MAIDIEEIDSEKNEQRSPSVNTEELLFSMQKEIEFLKKNQENANPKDESTKELITSLVKELKNKPDSEKYGGENFYVKPEDIDRNDLIEDGVTFFCHQVCYVIVDDIRQGFPIRTPFGNKILFKYQSTKKVGTGNETKLHNLSVYVSYSKKEVKWLNEHRGYGSIFFNSHVAAMSIDGKKAAKLARIMAVLQRMPVAGVIRMAGQNGIEPSEEIQTLRLSIANKQADDEIKRETESNAIKVKEALIESDILIPK